MTILLLKLSHSISPFILSRSFSFSFSDISFHFSSFIKAFAHAEVVPSYKSMLMSFLPFLTVFSVISKTLPSITASPVSGRPLIAMTGSFIALPIMASCLSFLLVLFTVFFCFGSGFFETSSPRLSMSIDVLAYSSSWFLKSTFISISKLSFSIFWNSGAT